MATINSKSPDGRQAAKLAEGLGWFSLGLGVPQLVAPGLVNRIAGIENDVRSRAAQRLVGLRELGHAAGILGTSNPAPWVWSRVAGDVMDLMLLGRAWASKRDSAARLALATVQVTGIGVLDLMTAIGLTRDGGQGQPRVRTAAVTLEVTQQEAEAAWARVARDLGVDGTPTFRTAPGGTGTEVYLRVPEGSVAQKAAGTDPYQQARDALRRFKQLVEAGEIARSDAVPEGETHERMFPRQRPAQPLEHVPA
jgi:hypothetical protein